MLSSKEQSDLPYGVTHFMRVGGVKTSLAINKDMLARHVESRLHRLELGNGNRLFPIDYIFGLVAHVNVADARHRRHMGVLARDYALTEQAQDEILRAELGFEAAVESKIIEFEDRRIVSARAIGGLLDFQTATVIKDWAMRPDILPSTDIRVPELPPDTYFAEQSFRNFYTWHRPDLSL